MKPGFFALIFTVPRSNITIGPQQDIWHPVRYSGHLLTKLFQGYFLFAFDDQLVMYMPADEAVGKGLHRIHQQVTADRLHNVFHEFWTVAFQTLPLLGGAVLAPGGISHSGPGGNRQFWPDENS